MQLAVAPATPPPHRAFSTPRNTTAGAAAFIHHARRERAGEVRGDLVRGVAFSWGPGRPAPLARHWSLVIGHLALACVLTSCSQLAEVYRAYDAHVDREIVAGRDDARGNYAEVRWSPRRSASAAAPATAGQVRAEGVGLGKAVAR